MPKCKNCGAELAGAEKFCGVCGAAVTAETAAAAPSEKQSKMRKSPKAMQGTGEEKRRKKIIVPIVCLLVVAALGVGGWFVYSNLFGGGSAGDDINMGDPPSADAPAHEQLFYEADTMIGYARMADDAGVTLQAEYTYGLALAHVSALRLCVDNILWLMGEGETVEEIIGAAPYGDWNEVVAVGLGSPMPFYFEGLLYQVQGKDTEAAACYQKAEANPAYVKRDFYYLRNMSVEELYTLRDTAAEKERAILDEYTPRTSLYAERTGAEFSQIYHAALAGENLESGDNSAAYGCFLNAVLANPQIPDCYSAAILIGLQIGQSDTALLILNEGLWAFPKNGELNYIAATLEYANGNIDGARDYLQTAMADTELAPEFSARCEQLLQQMGGQ